MKKLLIILIFISATTLTAGANEDLIKAVKAGNITAVQDALNSGASVNTREDQNGWTALIIAAHNGFDQPVNLLLQRGANVNLKDNNGNTALMWAVRSYPSTVDILLGSGANVNLKNNLNYAALAIAIRYKQDQIVNKLRSSGASE